MNRIDTKYAVPMSVLPAILEAAKNDYFAQEIDGKRIATYDTMYYDTASSRPAVSASEDPRAAIRRESFDVLRDQTEE